MWAISALTSKPRPIIGTFVQFVLVKNSGAAFSFATSFTVIFTLLSLAVVVAVAKFAPLVTSPGWLIAMGLLLGGVLGNLTDRIFRHPGFLSGYVIDWIEIPHWPVFNLADSAISVAAALALVLSLRNIAPITEVR
jgi:signal peptidase II